MPTVAPNVAKRAPGAAALPTRWRLILEVLEHCPSGSGIHELGLVLTSLDFGGAQRLRKTLEEMAVRGYVEVIRTAAQRQEMFKISSLGRLAIGRPDATVHAR